MLNLLGSTSRFCDGVSRRNFLKVGAFSFGATTLTLADVYRAEAAEKKQDPAPNSSHFTELHGLNAHRQG